MLEMDRMSPRSPTLAAELRDAFGRRQKELPARWLAADDTPWQLTGPATADDPAEVEATLCRAALGRHLADRLPRGIVCVCASASSASPSVLRVVSERGTVAIVAAVECDASLARDVARRLEDNRGADAPQVAALAADCTLELPIPDGFPRPRLYLYLGNTLGAVTAVGAVRMLRVLRSTMLPSDAVLLTLAVAAPAIATADSARHLRALTRINETFGAALDARRFACESRYDVEARRSETHLVARRAFEAAIPGVCDVRFRKGESIRTSVSCTFDHARLSAMLGGVGLSLRGWEQADGGHTAVAVACPAT